MPGDIIEECSDDRVCPNTNCQYDHHIKGANFCCLCGTLLYHRCENCADVNAKYSRFCYYCGSSISDAPSSQYEEDYSKKMGMKPR